MEAERVLAGHRSGFARARAELARAAASRRPIVAGPFLSEVGYESLYWVPLLRWFVERHRVDPARVIAFSRGGPVSWYSGVADRYVEVFDHVSPEELKDLRSSRVSATRSEKQLGPDSVDGRLLQAADLADGYSVLHPSLMYAMFWAYFTRAMRRPIRRVLDHTSFAPFGREETHDAKRVLAGLPDEYVALKPYFSGCFPDTPANRSILSTLVQRLSAATDVVLLSTGIELDDHADYTSNGGRIHQISGKVHPSDNLEIQSAIIRNASGLYTTYGGFAHLGPFLGAPTFAFYSFDDLNPAHLDVMWRAVDALRPLLGAGFALVHVDDLPLLELA